MKTILAAVFATLLAMTPAAPVSTFTVTDPDRGLFNMHPALVKDQT